MCPIRRHRPFARPGRLLIASLLAGTIANGHADEAHSSEAAWNLPIFDAHVHYSQPAWEPYPPAAVIEMMDRNGVAMGLVSSTPDEGTIRLREYAPRRIVPELRAYRSGVGPANWARTPSVADYLRQRLEQYSHEGIGEFHVNIVDPVDEPLLREIAAMASERQIPLHVHCGAEPIEWLYRLEPSLSIIWAHAGMTEPPAVIAKMMQQYPTLYADTSYREDEILPSAGLIDPEWRRLLERFADRFMIGSDTWVNQQWAVYDELISVNRQWLGLLPKAVAEKIAYGNAERLFGRKISPDLIGEK